MISEYLAAKDSHYKIMESTNNENNSFYLHTDIYDVCF
jgi:hypothetical protein